MAILSDSLFLLFIEMCENVDCVEWECGKKKAIVQSYSDMYASVAFWRWKEFTSWKFRVLSCLESSIGTSYTKENNKSTIFFPQTGWWQHIGCIQWRNDVDLERWKSNRFAWNRHQLGTGTRTILCGPEILETQIQYKQVRWFQISVS